MSTEDTPKPVASHAGRADLPALPVPIVKGDYTAGDMLAYARAAVAKEHSEELRICALRALIAWDGTVLPKAHDGMMQERMEDLRAALAGLGA